MSTISTYEELVKRAKKRKMKPVAKALSIGEEMLASHLRAYNISFVREFLFHPSRKWRFDFAFPEKKIAVEVEGGGLNGMPGRHQTKEGFEGDCFKYNAAAKLGWRLFRYTTFMVKSAVAIDELREVLA